MQDPAHLTILKTRLQGAITNIVGRKIHLELSSRLREDLFLDSMNLIELSIWIHGNFGVDLGRIAEENGKVFQTVQDLLDEIGST